MKACKPQTIRGFAEHQDELQAVIKLLASGFEYVSVLQFRFTERRSSRRHHKVKRPTQRPHVGV